VIPIEIIALRTQNKKRRKMLIVVTVISNATTADYDMSTAVSG
jgi:hypothetical protein